MVLLFRRLLFILTFLATVLLMNACGGDDDDGDGFRPQATLVVAVSPADAEVELTGPDGFSESFTGSEVFTGLEIGDYEATATLDGYEDEADSVQVLRYTTSTLTLNLMPSGSDQAASTGTLVAAVMPPDAMVEITGPDDFEESFSGSATLVDLEPGEYEATASAEGFEEQSDSVEVFAGRASALAFSLQPVGSSASTGTLNLSVSPATANVTISGPEDYEMMVTGSETLIGLEPGDYEVSASASGYASQSDTVAVAAGQSSNLNLFLRAVTDEDEERVAYRDAQGQLVEIRDDDVRADRFVFYSWLQNEEDGIEPGSADSPAPSAAEQDEIAPSNTQNLVASWVGYRADDNQVYPVAGADVRFRIDRQYADTLGSVHFGTADDARAGADEVSIDNDQAATVTNNANLRNSAFPVASDFPLFNRTGVATPDTDGFTWVTLFSPDRRARARVVTVASVGGTEIGKEVLIKRFAPLAQLRIEKSVDTDELNIGTAGSGQVTFTINVINEGQGDATSVVLQDRLASGASDAYEIEASTLPAEASAVDDGFDLEFSLPAGETATFEFDATLSGTDTFCNAATVVEYADEFRTVTRDLTSDVCTTAIEPDLQVIKDFVTEDGDSRGDRVTIAQDETARLRVRITNDGGAAASGLRLSDALTEVDDSASSGDNGSYGASELPSGATANGDDGFDVDVGNVAADETVEYFFEVSATSDGEYCDTVTLSSGAGEVGTDTACLVVATPELEIQKTNSLDTVVPGTSYTSTVTVTNTGNATAEGVMLSDLLGQDDASGTIVELVSSDFDGMSANFSENVVSAPEAIDLAAGESISLTVTSRMPEGAPSGDYCDVGRFESDNASSDEVEACVFVPSFAALQTQLIDTDDPLRPGQATELTSTLFNEGRSNEAVSEHALTYSFGTESAGDNGSAGAFQQTETRVYLDDAPTRDSRTGLVVSTPSNASASLLEAGDDYEVTTDETGLQVIEFDDAFSLDANMALYIVHTVNVAEGTEPDEFSSTFSWMSEGEVSGTSYDAFASEVTTVIE